MATICSSVNRFFITALSGPRFYIIQLGHFQGSGHNGHRLYCDNTSGANGPALPFSARRKVILNLCDFFSTKDAHIIFVLDERDKDRDALEMLFAGLLSQGHKITIEYDSAEKRENALDDMHLGILKAGKKLSINGVEIETVEDYWRWKRQSNLMQRQPMEYAMNEKRTASPARRMAVVLMIGAGLCVVAFIVSFFIIVMYVGGG